MQVTPWAKDWFQRELKLTIEGDNTQRIVVEDVEVLEGDVELGQRKSKLIAIYDVQLKLHWSGSSENGSKVSGTLNIPEVSHEITLDKLHGYAYEWNLSSDAKNSDELYQLARSRLPAALEVKFAEFPVVLMSVHGKDITVAGQPDQPVPSVKAAKSTSSTTATSAKTPATKNSINSITVNTTTLSVDATFMASAADLFDLLTNEKRIPQWSRNAAVSSPNPGSSFSLFGGGVKGTFTSVSAPEKFVQAWALQQSSWPTGHFATLTTSLEQSTDSTKVTWSMTGIPVGIEDEIQRNIQGYYVGGLKSIGYVQIASTTHFQPLSQPSIPSSRIKKPSGLLTYIVVVFGIFAILTGVYFGR